MKTAIPLLRRTLVDLYDDVRNIQTVSDDTGVDGKKIPWKNAAVYVWHQVIKECLKKEVLPTLVENVRIDYKSNKTLLEIENEINDLPNELEKILNEIGLDLNKIGILDLVNSGRHKESNDFWDPKEADFKNQQLLTGIISGAFKQNPKSLAERLVYEYLDVMETDTQAVFYQRDPTNFNIKSLVIDSKTPESLDRKIGKYLEAIQDNRELSKFSAIAHILEVDITAAHHIISDMIAPTIEKFRKFSLENEVFNLLLIVFRYTKTIDIDDLDKKLQSVAKDSHDIKYFRQLTGLDNEEMIQWFSENGASNSERVNYYIDQFLDTDIDSQTRKSFEQTKKLDMNVMELIQKQVFKYAVKKDNKKESHEDV